MNETAHTAAPAADLPDSLPPTPAEESATLPKIRTIGSPWLTGPSDELMKHVFDKCEDTYGSADVIRAMHGLPAVLPAKIKAPKPTTTWPGALASITGDLCILALLMWVSFLFYSWARH